MNFTDLKKLVTNTLYIAAISALVTFLLNRHKKTDAEPYDDSDDE